MSDIGQDAGQQPVDRKELLASQFDDVEKTAATDAGGAPPASSGDRPRAPDGKFAPKIDVAPAVAAPLANAAPAAVEPPVWDKAPASWKKEKHALWQSMTPEQREYAFQREEQMRSGVEPLLPKAQLADAINKAAEPYMNTIRGMGLELPQAVAGLMKADHDLRTLPYDQKLALLNNIAAGYGINLSGQMQNAQQMNPGVQGFQNELLQVKGQLSNFVQQQEAAQQRTLSDEIQKFSQTAEHFEDVKPAMVQLLQSGMAGTLQEAYEKAIRLDPEIFGKVQSAQQAAAEQAKRATANAAAQKAKTAAVSVRSATPGTAKATNAQDRRSMLSEQLSGLSERL